MRSTNKTEVVLTSPDLGATVIRQPNVFAMRQHSTSRDRSEPPTLTGRRTLPALPVALPLGGRNAHQKRITCCIPDRLQPSDPLLSSHIALSLVITGSSTMRNQHQILYFFLTGEGKKSNLEVAFYMNCRDSSFLKCLRRLPNAQLFERMLNSHK